MPSLEFNRLNAFHHETCIVSAEEMKWSMLDYYKHSHIDFLVEKEEKWQINHTNYNELKDERIRKYAQ